MIFTLAALLHTSAVAFLPKFLLTDDATPVGRMAGLGLAFMAVTLAVFALYAVAAARVRRQILARPSVLLWMRPAFAAAFVGLGLKLALAER